MDRRHCHYMPAQGMITFHSCHYVKRSLPQQNKEMQLEGSMMSVEIHRVHTTDRLVT
jgi:hypothetical protein